MRHTPGMDLLLAGDWLSHDLEKLVAGGKQARLITTDKEID